MGLSIQGIGWVSSLARGPIALIELLRQQSMFGNESPLIPETQGQPRLRRSGRISQLAGMAVQDALTDAGKEWTSEEASRTALIFLSTHGGICHTIRFFEGIARDGTAAGSPIFFPETVYNAPPSHIAAHLGIDGMVTSLVGDSSAVGAAVHTAEEWIYSGICEQCLIVAAEEIHPLLKKAYGHLRRGSLDSGESIFLEAAAAVLMGQKPGANVVHAHHGMVIRRDSHLPRTLRHLFHETANGKTPKMVLTSAMDAALKIKEHVAVAELWPDAQLFHPKDRLGESFAASSLGNVVIGESLLRQGETASILISLLGASGQASALLLTPNT